MSSHFYEFGAFRLDPAQGVLARGGQPVPLTPKAWETLLALVESGGRVVSKEELLKRVWPDTFVEEGSLTHNVWTIRKALGEEEGGPKYIETVPRRGYRFAVPVAKVARDANAVRDGAPEPDVASAGEATAPPPPRRTRPWILLALLAAAATILVARRPPSSDPPAPPPAVIRRLAVLPFKPVAGAGGEHLELGMADALITKLSNVRDIDVRPTRAIARYTDPGKDLLAAGRELQVDAILDGTLQRDGDRVRVTVQLVRVADGKPLWAETFDERWTDIFALQDRVSEQVARRLALRLSVEEAERLRRRYTDNAEAYQLYLMGRFFWNKRTPDAIRKAVTYYDQAIAVDPRYALAYAGLAESYVLLPWYGGIPPSEAFERARAAATRALELDERLASAHTALAYVAERYDWDWAKAEAGYRRAIELHPSYATAHQWYAEYLVPVGRFDEALSEMRRALALDPLSLIINAEMATLLFHAGRYEDALAQAKRTLELDPGFLPARMTLGRVYMQTGRHAEAGAVFRKALDDTPGDAWVLSHVAYNDAIAGDHESARRLLARMHALGKGKPVAAELIATVLSGLGDDEAALDWLEKSCRARETGLAWIAVNPAFARLHGYPRYRELVRCVGLPPVQSPS